MAVKSKGLGRGIDGLIPNKTSVEKKTKKESVVTKKTEKKIEEGLPLTVKITMVEPNRNQPRKNFDEDALIELSESIKNVGIISPLVVKKKDDYFEIIAGERRWRAAKLAGLKEVPVIINNNYDDQQTLEVSIIENIQREKLNPIEEGLAYKRLIDEFDLKQDEVAERVSKSRTEITNKMRLLKLDERVQEMLISEMISMGHARALLGFENNDDQYSAALKVFDEKLSVRDIEKLVKNAAKVQKEKKKEIDEQYKVVCEEAANKMSTVMGTKVNINQKNKDSKGKIEIEFYSQEELDRIMSMILSLQ